MGRGTSGGAFLSKRVESGDPLEERAESGESNWFDEREGGVPGPEGALTGRGAGTRATGRGRGARGEADPTLREPLNQLRSSSPKRRLSRLS